MNVAGIQRGGNKWSTGRWSGRVAVADGNGTCILTNEAVRLGLQARYLRMNAM